MEENTKFKAMDPGYPYHEKEFIILRNWIDEHLERPDPTLYEKIGQYIVPQNEKLIYQWDILDRAEKDTNTLFHRDLLRMAMIEIDPFPVTMVGSDNFIGAYYRAQWKDKIPKENIIKSRSAKIGRET